MVGTNPSDFPWARASREKDCISAIVDINRIALWNAVRFRDFAGYLLEKYLLSP
jgi:hypothetical protein